MTNAVVILDQVTKKFVINRSYTLKDAIIAFIKKRKMSTGYTALDGVSFTVTEGETVGLLGFNGSGKSTTLKLISGVLRPDSGKILTRGRVAGLIEVGAGFHPDLTGRQNIYLNAAILGMNKKEIDARFDEIVEFSEIGQFLDTEVRFYSSGMFVRLAFSVAIHSEFDLLLIDEVLSVGDEPFQAKCLERIDEIRTSGKTLIIVSHNLDMIAKLCSRAILVTKGKLIFDGNPVEAIATMRKLKG